MDKTRSALRVTEEQSPSINKDPRIRQLVPQRKESKCRFKGKQPIYQHLGREFFNERQQKRVALLK